jgi:hypothetical protein
MELRKLQTGQKSSAAWKRKEPERIPTSPEFSHVVQK